jgi:Zinc-binding dehydrogenase
MLPDREGIGRWRPRRVFHRRLVASTRSAGPDQTGKIREHDVREQHLAMLAEKREHTARLQQMSRHRLHIPQLRLPTARTLHRKIISVPPHRAGHHTELFSTLLDPVVRRIAAFLGACRRTGALHPTVDRVFTLDDIVEAHRHLERGQ